MAQGVHLLPIQCKVLTSKSSIIKNKSSCGQLAEKLPEK
jgi:hypothetical protein